MLPGEHALDAAAAYAVAKYRDGQQVAWSVAGEAFAAATLHTSFSLVGVWIAEFGATAALEVLVAARLVGRSSRSSTLTIVGQGPHASSIGRGVPGQWRALRTYLCVAPPREYDAALAMAQGLRASAGLPLRCALSYAFPQMVGWAAEDARTSLAPPPPAPPSAALLFASLCDAEPLLALLAAARGPVLHGLSARCVEDAIADGRLAVALARLEDRHDDVIDALLSIPGLRREAIAELYSVAPRAATRAMVHLVGDAGADGAARVFLDAHPGDALVALAEQIANRKRHAVLTPLLAGLAALHRDDALALARQASPRVARVLRSVGATEALLPTGAANGVRQAIEAVGYPGFSQWLARSGSREEARDLLRSAAASGACAPRLGDLVRSGAVTALPLALEVVDALADAGGATSVFVLAHLAQGLVHPGVEARARERLRTVNHIGEADVLDMVVPRARVGARERRAQVERLEAAMVEGRRWTASNYQRNVLGHPVLLELARGLAWALFDEADSVVTVFRIGAKGEPIRPEGEDLPLLGVVGIPHPVELTPAQLAWARDVELGLSPFEQITRAGGAAGVYPSEVSRRQLGARLQSFGWSRFDPSAGEGNVDYYRVIRGREVTLTVFDEGEGRTSVISANELLGGNEGTRDDRVAAFEATRDVARAVAPRS